MKQNKKIADDFLLSYGMYYGSLREWECYEDFLNEMKKGLETEKSSLKMIPTYIRENKISVSAEPVIVIDIGGTNIRIALVSLETYGKAIISDYAEYKTPGTTEEIDGDTFFRLIAEYVKPLLAKSRKIGICFSYSAKPDQNKDAVILAAEKQLRVKNFIGRKVGNSLKQALMETGEQLSCVVINDTVAVALGGRALETARKFGGYLGFVFGTGMNVCYSENAVNILKIADNFFTDRMLINIEAGGYCGFPRGKIDLDLDNSTMDAGSDQFEKMVSGKYQGALLYKVLEYAVNDGIFSEEFAYHFQKVSEIPSRESDEFLLYPFGTGILSRCCGKPDNLQDREILYGIIDDMHERAALLCSIVLGASLAKSGIGKSPLFPAFIAAEGSAFYGSKSFNGKMQIYMDRLIRKHLGIYSGFFQIPNATLVGTAIAATVN